MAKREMTSEEIKKSKKKALKLRKPHVVGAIIFYFLMFVFASLVLSLAMAVFTTHYLLSRAYSEIDYARTMAKIYDSSVIDGKVFDHELIGQAIGVYKIVDKEGEVKYINGEDTLDMTKSSSVYTFDGIPYGQYIRIYSDSSTGYLPPVMGDDRSVDINYDENDIDMFFSTIGRHDDLDLSFWVGIGELSDGSTFFYRAEMMITPLDYTFTIVFAAVIAIVIFVLFLIIIVNSITHLVSQRRMTKLLFMDYVSDNHNWMWFLIKGEEKLRKFRYRKSNFAVVNLVFVKFRNYVLCHSVEEGEEMLAKVYKVITENIDKKDMCARTSSSFPMLVRYTDENDLKMRIHSIIGKLEKVDSDHRFNFQAGIDFIPATPERRKDPQLEMYYNNACAARISISDSGESGIAVFDRKLLNDQKWIDNVNERQQNAIDREEFIVYYQPKYDPRTDKLMGAEALVRWQTETGLVPPGKFIPIFEESGFITELDHYMIRHVARDQKRWVDAGYECVPVSVNVSRAHFVESDLAEQIRDIVDSEGCPHNLVEIELTESAFFDDKNALLHTISHLQQYGFAVSMDDFGSGYSSLNSLKDLPLNVLKLDAGFFRGSDDEEREHIVVKEAIRLAKGLNMITVAEGVEDKAQVDFLASEGCDMIQGYYYAKPMPAGDYVTRMSGGAASVAAEVSGVSEEKEAPEESGVTEVNEVTEVSAVPEAAEAPVAEAAEAPVAAAAETPVTEPVAEPEPAAPAEQSFATLTEPEVETANGE